MTRQGFDASGVLHLSVTTPQMATWIERDGWRAVAYLPDGSRRYESPNGFSHIVWGAAHVDELDAERDRVARRLYAARMARR
jgi:hypothetical protein